MQVLFFLFNKKFDNHLGTSDFDDFIIIFIEETLFSLLIGCNQVNS